MDLIVNVDNFHSIFIPTVFEILHKVKTNTDQYQIIGDKHFQSYFLKFDEITDFLEKDKEYFQLYGFHDNSLEQIYNNLNTIYSLLEMLNKKNKKIDSIQIYGIESILAGIFIRKYLNHNIHLYINFIPEKVLNGSFSKYRLINNRLLKSGCEQAEYIFTINDDIKQFLIWELLIPEDKIKIYQPNFYCSNAVIEKNKNLLFIHIDDLTDINSEKIKKIIEQNNISIVVTNNKTNSVKFYHYILKYFPDNILSFITDDLYHYNFFHLLESVSKIVMVNNFIEDSNNSYFQSFISSQNIQFMQIDLLEKEKV